MMVVMCWSLDTAAAGDLYAGYHIGHLDNRFFLL